MADIHEDSQCLALPAESAAIQTTDHPRRLQGRGDLPGVPRQVQQQIGLQRQRSVFHRQVEQRQIVQLDHLPAAINAPPLPVLIRAGEIEIAPTQEERAR
ncbi:hypothetical protein D3C78_1365190 [compost metagenome]